ncbi:hypothetical protein HID58_002454, partial [Brassica napus]
MEILFPPPAIPPRRRRCVTQWSTFSNVDIPSLTTRTWWWKMVLSSVLGEGMSQRLQVVGVVNRWEELCSRYVVALLSRRRYRPTFLDAMSAETGPLLLLVGQGSLFSVRNSSIAKKVKTQNESEADAAGNESEADAAGKGSSGKEGSKELELENKATLTTIVNTLDITSRKFDQVDSRLEAYELDRNRPLMDQKTIDDRASLVVRTHQKSVNSPALVDATPRNLRPLDFLVISPAKATKDDKSTKDDKAAKDPAYGYGCRRTRIVKGEEADEKKKAAQADAAFKRKEKVTPPRDGVTRCNVQPDVEDSSLADITNEVVAEQNEFAPESDVENSELVRSAIIKEFREKNVRLTPKGLSTMAVSSSFVFLTAIPPKPPAPPGKKEVLTADHESDFYSILIHERPWSEAEYLWVFDNV